MNNCIFVFKGVPADNLMDPVPSQSFGSPKDNGNTARVAQSDSDDKKEQDQVAVGSGDAQLNQSGVGATALFTLQGSETSNLVKEENSSGELGVVMNSKSSESISQELHQEVTPDTQQNHTTIASIIPSNHGKNIDSNNSMISSDVEVQVSNSQTGSDIMQANRAQFSPLNHSQNTVSSSSMAGVSSIKASTHQTTSLFSATPVSSLQPSVSLFSEVHALRSQPYISYQNVPMSYAPGTLSEAREVLPVPAIQSKCDHKVQDSVVALDSMQRREPKVINAEQAPSVASASGSSTAGVGSHSGGTPRVKDALGYLERVKEVFKGKLDVYSNFLDIMKQFKAQT